MPPPSLCTRVRGQGNCAGRGPGLPDRATGGAALQGKGPQGALEKSDRNLATAPGREGSVRGQPAQGQAQGQTQGQTRGRASGARARLSRGNACTLVPD